MIEKTDPGRGVSGLCADCRYWHSPPGAVGWGYCRLAATVGGDAATPTTRAQAMAGRESHEDGDAVLLTNVDFGCVQFEPPVQAGGAGEAGGGA